MGRWEPDAKGRLAQAAFELFVERGFDQTTTAEIAERAGLTERTFFRHFTDKREVLFEGSAALQEMIVSRVAAAPDDATPMEAAITGFRAGAGVLEEFRERSAPRQALILAHPELQEREAVKMATIAAAVALTLRERGVTEPAASLTAETAVGIFRVAFNRWVETGQVQTLAQVIDDALAELRRVTAA
jgi:AcrR family transcriptional regulator